MMDPALFNKYHDYYVSYMCICIGEKKSVPTVIKDFLYIKNVYVTKTVNGSNLYHLAITK